MNTIICNNHELRAKGFCSDIDMPAVTKFDGLPQ